MQMSIITVRHYQQGDIFMWNDHKYTAKRQFTSRGIYQGESEKEPRYNRNKSQVSARVIHKDYFNINEFLENIHYSWIGERDE